MNLRPDSEHLWAPDDPYLELWHGIIDTYGYPTWIRQYRMERPRTDAAHAIHEADVREVLGDRFACVLLSLDDDPSETCVVYGYMPIDFHKHDLTHPYEESPGGTLLPAGWVTLAPTVGLRSLLC